MAACCTLTPTDLLLSVKQEPYMKAYLLTTTTKLKNFVKKVRSTGQPAAKGKTENVTGLG